jgi:tetratricopeptide (TPR) repeat protein
MESIEAIRIAFDSAQAIADKALAQQQMGDLMTRLSSFYSAVGGRDVVMRELDGNMQTIASLLAQAPGWEEALDAIMLESEILLLKSQLQSDLGHWSPSAESLEAAILIAQKLGDEFAHAKALRQWGLMSLMQQMPAKAEELFKRSARLFRRYSRALLRAPPAP